jgi:hypothetical protein
MTQNPLTATRESADAKAASPYRYDRSVREEETYSISRTRKDMAVEKPKRAEHSN